MKLLYEKNKITPKDDKTNIILPFDVPSGVRTLTVKYNYSPKTVPEDEAKKILMAGMKKYGVPYKDINELLPVNNLVTLSFDDPLGYRGACHRQPNVQEIVLGEESTCGILNRRLVPGRWQAVLNIHYAGCEIDYEIEVSAK